MIEIKQFNISPCSHLIKSIYEVSKYNFKSFSNACFEAILTVHSLTLIHYNPDHEKWEWFTKWLLVTWELHCLSLECLTWITFQFGNSNFRLFWWKLFGREWDFNFPGKIRKTFCTSPKEKGEAQLVGLGRRGGGICKSPDGAWNWSPWKFELNSFFIFI